jgi:glutathione S-transferase
MTQITVSAFRWVPPFAEGVVRDLRVRWALEEANLSYDTRLISLEERKSSWYRKMHPFGMVPACEIDGHGLFESGAIVWKIASDCAALMSSEPSDRAKTIQWMFAALNTVEPPLADLFAMDVFHSKEEWAKLRRPALVDQVKERLRSLSTCLEGREYLLERFTVADVLMTTVLRFVRHTDLVAELGPVAAYQARCEARPAFQRALAAQLAAYAKHAPTAA